MSIFDFRKAKCEKLAEQGYECIRQGDCARALEIAEQLEKLRYSAAFEIAALAHAELDDLEAAVRVLTRGLEKAPTAWLNWQLLGNYLSDLKRYEEAAVAYEKGLACRHVKASSIRLNQAILASRQCLHAEALQHLEQLVDPEWQYRKASAKVTALIGLGRIEEAIQVGEAALPSPGDEASPDLGYLASAIARARTARGDPADRIFEYASTALERYDRSNRALLAAIRNADARYSSGAQYYRMTVDAKIPFTSPLYREAKGYIVHYDVVADTLEEALRYVERMEDPVVRGNLLVDEHEILEERPEDPKGVYRRSDRYYYARED